MSFKERFAKLFSSSFLMCALGAGYEFATGHPGLGLAAILFYVLLDRGPQAVAQVIAVLKGIDRVAEALGLTKVDAVLDEVVAGLDSRLAGMQPALATGNPSSATSVSAPVAEALGKS